MSGDTLTYAEKPWPNKMSTTVANDRIVVRIPWSDLGIIPFDGRIAGLGVMAFDAKGLQTASLPAKADFYNPGTWCDIQLAK